MNSPFHTSFAIKKSLKRIFFILIFSILLAFIGNAFRSEPLHFIAHVPYEIYNDCPELQENLKPLRLEALNTLIQQQKKIYYVDARSLEAWNTSHVPGALNLPYDVLELPNPKIVNEILQHKQDMIVVYGNNVNGIDQGKLLASDLQTLGLKRVYYLVDGFQVWQDATFPLIGD